MLDSNKVKINIGSNTFIVKIILHHKGDKYNCNILLTEIIMKTDDRYQRGLKKIKEIYGDAWDIDFLDDISPEFGRYTVDFLFGDIYNLETLDARSREIAIIASLVTLGNANTPLKIHIRGALNIGCSKQEIIEIIIQTAVYAGFPAGVNALMAAKEVFNELNRQDTI